MGSRWPYHVEPFDAHCSLNHSWARCSENLADLSLCVDDRARFLQALPSALTATYHRLDADIRTRSPKTGTTATCAVLVGWQMVVATVGDTCMHLDVGVLRLFPRDQMKPIG